MKRLFLFFLFAVSISFVPENVDAASAGAGGTQPVILWDFISFEDEEDGTQYICIPGSVKRCTYK
jgi:hypothetical protein